MLNKRISDLPQATALTDHDLFAVLQEDNTTRKINFVDMIREVNAIVEITFEDLNDLIDAGTMSAGTSYQIEFQTKHEIPGTGVINTGATEHLLLYAVSESDLLEEAISIEYPQDQILFDITDVLCEDGTTARQGKITYRKDRIKNLETWYDFRNVKFRRYKMDTASNTAWAATTAYSSGNVVYNGNIFYSCIDSHTSDSSFSDAHWQIIGYGDLTKKVAWDTSGFNGIHVDATSYEDLLTFNHADTHDITIKAMYDRSEYNNIVFVKYDDSSIPYGFTMGENCSQMTIEGGHYQNSFGQNCSSVIMGNDSSLSDIIDNVVGNDLSGAYFSNASYNTIGQYCGNIVLVNGANKNTLENNVWQANIESSELCHLGHTCDDTKIESSDAILIGPYSSNNRFTNGSGQNTLGSYCSNNTFDSNSQYNVIDASGYHNQFTNGSYDNRLSSNCHDNVFSSGSESWLATEASSNTISGCYLIIIGAGSSGNSFTNSPYNILGNSCNSNTFINGAYNNILGLQCGSNHFDNAAYTSLGSDSSNNSLTNSYRISLGIGCDSNTFSPYCDSISIGNNCDGNSFTNAEYMSMGNYCNSNTFTGYSYYNSLGNNCSNNSFYNYSCNNSFGNNCTYNAIGSNTYGSSSNNSFANTCSNNTLSGGNNNNSFENYCNHNTLGVNASNNTLGNNCTFNAFSSVGSSSAGYSNNRLGAGCNNLSLQGNGLIFGESCSYINVTYSLNCTFAPGMSNKTFPNQYYSNFLIGDNVSKTYTTNGYKITVDMCSGDGSWWYNAIDNSGVVTTTKFV